MFRFVTIALVLQAVVGFASSVPSDPSAVQLKHDSFVPNMGQIKNEKGQAANNVLLATVSNGQQLFVTTEGFTYVFIQQRPQQNGTVIERKWRLNVRLNGATIKRSNVEWLDRVGDETYNYFYAHCPNGVLDVHAYHALRVHNVYPGVDWYIEKNASGLKYNFELQPGANPEQIRMDYDGAQQLRFDQNGNIVVTTPLGQVTEAAPKSYQDGREVATIFRLGQRSISFDVAAYDKAKSLQIDPTLIWGTVFGGFLKDEFRSMTYDNSGHLYATGYTTSPDFPVMNAGAFFTDTLAGPVNTSRSDVIIVKFNPNNSLQWATYYGGSGVGGPECGYATLVDLSSNLFIAGVTNSPDFPTQNAGTYFDGTLGGNTDGFLIKFNAAGQRVFATFIGGTNDDGIYDLCVDAAANVYACGYTNSSNFPLQTNGTAYYQSTNSSVDGFVSKFSNNGSLVWSTLLGGNQTDETRSIATDGVNVFVSGFTNSTNFPLQNAGTYYQSLLNGTGAPGNDLFISKFDGGGALVWSTYYGGSSEDFGMSIATTPAGELYVLGATKSANFPVQSYNANSYYDSQLNNGDTSHYDACILKFTNNGNRLWSTYFGGSGDEVRLSYRFMPYMNDQLRTDACGNVYGALISRSSNMPVYNALCNSYFNPTRGGQQDPILFKFTRQQKLQWSTFYGGSNDDENGLCIALNRKSTIAVSGNTGPSYGTPIVYLNNAYNSNSIDSIDAYIGVFTQPSFTPAVSTSMCNGSCSGTVNLGINSACSAPGYTYNWSNGLSGSSATGLCAGTYTITITDTLNCVADTAIANVNSGISVQPLVNAVSCNYACTGYASINLPGAASLVYQWSNGTTGQQAAALCPGNYSVTVTEPGCGSVVAPFNIVLPPPLIIQLGSLEPTCGLNCNASASVVVTGGETLPYISWSNGTIGPTSANLCPNQNYVITASDSLCYSATYNLTVPIAYMTGSITQVHDCACDNTLVLQVNNANNYHIHWSTNDTTATVTGLCPGIYHVTITDAYCGTLAINDTIQHLPTPYVYSQHAHFEGCPDSCDVWVDVNIGPSTGPSTYFQYPGPVSIHWYDAAGNPVYFGMCIGHTYHWVWTDGCGDTLTGFATPYPSYPFWASVMPLNYTCPGTCDGVMSLANMQGVLNIMGGTPPYTEVWSNGYSGLTSYNLCVADSYSVTITDACGYQLIVPFVFPQASHVQVNMGYSPSCAASCNGTAYAFSEFGVGPYHYVWNNGTTLSQFTQACANTWYYVTVYDACDSVDNDSVLVLLAPPQTNSVSQSATACALQCNGTATVLSYGGTPPFLYYWNTGANGSQVSNLCALVNYSVVVVDPGCSIDTLSFVIPVDQVHIALDNLVDNDCYYSCDGSVNTHVNGGSPPFGYSWSNGAVTPNVSGLCQGTYVLVVYDPGCSVDSMTVNVNGPAPTQATATVLDTLICNYDCMAHGLVQITGGVPPFNVLWSNGSTDTLTNTLCHGTNFVVVNDPGCWADTLYVNVQSLSQIQSQVGSVTGTLCFDSCNGTASVSAFNGIAPYQYAWTNGESLDTAVHLCAGVSTVTITDSLGCTDTKTVTIIQPTPVLDQLSVTPSHCWNSDGQISVEASGGTPGYHYIWSNGATDSVASDLIPRTYSLTIQDANGCPRYDSAAFLGLYPHLHISNDTTVYIGQQTPLFVSGANTYNWYPSNGLSCYSCDTPMAFVLNTTTFCVLGIDTYGCPDSACATVIINTDCGVLRFPNAFTPNGDGLNDVFRPVGLCMRTCHMIVCNRWGQVVCDTYDFVHGWNGKYNGEDAEIGTYAFYADAENWLNQRVQIKGNVTLIR